VIVPAIGGIKESRAPSLSAKAMEAVQILECSREELLGVEGVERSEGDGGNWGGRPRPGGCGSSLERDVL
jgi:hypothetical protein